MGEQLLKRNLGDFGIHLVLQFGEDFGERRIRTQFPCLNELSGQKQRERLAVRSEVEAVLDRHRNFSPGAP